MKTWHKILLVISGLCVAAAVLAVADWYRLHPAPLLVQGQVEAKEVRVSSKLAGRVSLIHVKEGDSVKEHDRLVTLESPEIEAKLAQASAARNAAQAHERKAIKGTRPEKIRSAHNVWKKARAAAELAEKTYKRIERLEADGVLPAQKLDEAEAEWKASNETAEAARATYDMALAGTRQEDKSAAMAMVEKAAGAVSEVEAYLKETELAAPISGEVADIIAERGELVAQGFPLLVLVDLKDVWVTFNLPEDLLADIRMGSSIEAAFPALKEKKISLKVNYISAMGDFATLKATKATGDFDMRTFEVRAVPETPVRGLRPGMSAVVDWSQFLTDQKTGSY